MWRWSTREIYMIGFCLAAAIVQHSSGARVFVNPESPGRPPPSAASDPGPQLDGQSPPEVMYTTPAGGSVLGEEVVSPVRGADDHSTSEFRFFAFRPVVIINACSTGAWCPCGSDWVLVQGQFFWGGSTARQQLATWHDCLRLIARPPSWPDTPHRATHAGGL